MSTAPADDAPTAELLERLNRETAEIGWSELARHFARGVVVVVEPSVDLLRAAVCMASDDSAQIDAWLSEGHMRRASDDDARDWSVRAPAFWCVVAAPWVLVQERRDAHVVH